MDPKNTTLGSPEQKEILLLLNDD